MKKSSQWLTPCRYFANTGSCLHGKECQFLHESPRNQNNSHQLNNSGISDSDGTGMCSFLTNYW